MEINFTHCFSQNWWLLCLLVFGIWGDGCGRAGNRGGRGRCSAWGSPLPLRQSRRGGGDPCARRCTSFPVVLCALGGRLSWVPSCPILSRCVYLSLCIFLNTETVRSSLPTTLLLLCIFLNSRQICVCLIV